MESIKLWSWVFSFFLGHLFAPSKRSRIIFEVLIQGHSYRIPGQQGDRIILFFIYFKQSLTLLLRSTNRHIDNNGDTSYALFDGTIEAIPRRKAYFQKLPRKKPYAYLYREDLGISGHFLEKLLFLLVLLPFSLATFCWCLFSKRSAIIGLLQLEFTELFCLMLHLRELNSTHLYFFCSFEVDGNLISAYLMDQNIDVHRIPSSVPLSFYYRSVIASEFTFTAPFQREEAEEYADLWMVDRTSHLPCFTFQLLEPSLLDHDQFNTANTGQATLGFLSSGVWRRKERGDNKIEMGDWEAEEILMTFLQTFLTKHPDIKLFVFLHPCERETAQLHSKALKTYQDFFSTDQVSIAPQNDPSYLHFNKADVSFSVYSSANIEMLFCGHKAFYCPIGLDLHQYETTSLRQISLLSYEAFEAATLKSLPLSGEDFFTSFGIEDYYRFGMPSSQQP